MNSSQWFLYLCIFKGCVCCDPFNMDRKEHPTLKTAFLECTFKGRWEIVHCPLVSGRIGIYDNRFKKCTAFGSTEQGLREKRQSATLPTASGSQRVGEECNFNTDCVSGGYCETGACKCWSTHVAIQSYCWRKVNPEQAGCSHDEQCSAVWPGARCVNSVCKCPNDRTPSPTREGPVCHSLGQCPTNGANPLLYGRNTNTPSRCFFFDLAPDLPRADRFLGCDDFPDIYDCIDGFCCPTRAFACTQATDSGQQLSGFVGGLRWYYNAASQSCQTFNYLGIGGNANNFLTREQCESYCMARCIRGQPQLDQTLSSNNNLANLIASCSTRAKGAALSTCDETRYECSRIESLAMCCPLPAYICSNFGGIGQANNDTTPPPFSTGSNRLGHPELVRWYWDSSTKTCQTFRYLGQGGNFNNFLSEQDCVEYCSKSLCPHGVPLQENSGPSNMLCAKNNDCPASHYCISTVCCPTADTVCNQPLALGAFCNASPMTRYWYNSAQAACEAFEFNGCQGNANNFGTIVDCQRFCSDIKEEPQCQQGKALRTSSGTFYQCSLNSGSIMQCPTNYECTYDGSKHGCCPSKCTVVIVALVGTMCNPSTSSRWYFDSVAQSCKTFQYYGCDGNANNFATQRDCENFCEISGCPDGGQVLKDTFGNALLCTSNVAICPLTHECTHLDSRRVVSSGRYCCPTRMSMCAQPSDKGSNCGQNVQRYAFHGESNTCEAFQFLGCGGNANNFLSKEICLNLCHAAACIRGEVVYRHPITRTVVECEFSGINQSCPQGFRCVSNPLTKRNICCGSPKLGLCPRNQLVYLDARNQQARHCTANLAGICPKDWSCLFNTDFNQFFCCGDPYQSLCSLNSSLLRNRATGDPVGCSLKNRGTCPHGYSCQTSSPLIMSGFCCESRSRIYEPVCPAGFVGLSTSQKDMDTCSPLIPSSCPDQFFCIFSEMHSRFTCCQKGDLAENTKLCPPNSTALLSAEARRPQTCLFGEDSSCPPPYVCEQRDSGMGLCCRSTKSGKIGGSSVDHIQPLSNKTLIAQTKAAQLEHPIACAKGTVLSSSGDRCLKAMSPLEFGCIESIQCLKNSYCSQQFCVCRKGFVQLGKTCYEHCPLGWIEFHNKCVLHNRKLISVNWRNPT